MNKEFIPYEQALALKELGFDEECFAYYDAKHYKKDELRYILDICSNTSDKWISEYKENCAAPLYQQAFRWFREKYGLWHQIYRDGSAEHNIVFQIWSNRGIKSFKYESKVTSYEEAELACLRKLIEIVKEK